MGDKVWTQCTQCGALCRVGSDEVLMSDDDLYTEPIKCNCCKNRTKHLVIGAYKDDFYAFGNHNLDVRYFIY